MTFEDAVEDWKVNDEWRFADREAAWRFMFERGQESLRQQLAFIKLNEANAKLEKNP